MKKNNKKGFTLAEMLIVVAIIGVLIAIMVPTFTSQLEKAKVNTDLANIRSLVSECQSAYLLESGSGTNVKKYTATVDLTNVEVADKTFSAAKGKEITIKVDSNGVSITPAS